MMRYLKQLADRDYALDRGMIPLGSCTMKLNAATEMAAVSWPEFSRVHPFAPEADVRGYLAMIEQLEVWLAEVTGYDAVSLQPNAGSQGELAGLLAIRGYHHANGELERTVCLIPSSAHGTNAASAVLAGMKVVVVACDEAGNVDLDDLRAKIEAHADQLSALMITYPSTHGVYEHEVLAITQAVHDAGGQVYVDGANLNALLGFARFGDLGGDVSHLNLHKTFAIPHGGGGPGVGPVAAKAHLAPYLPGHPFSQRPDHAGGSVRGRARLGGTARLGRHPADLVGVSAHDGRRGASGCHGRRGARGQLHRHAAGGPLPRAVRGGGRPRRARVHPRPASAPRGDGGHRRRRREAAHRLRLPRADDVVPGRGHADGRADRVRGPRRDRALHRRDDRDQGRGPGGRGGRVAGRRQPARQRPAHRRGGRGGGVDAPVHAASRRCTRSRRSSARSTGRRCAGSTRPTATATSCAPARRWRPSPSAPRARLARHPPDRETAIRRPRLRRLPAVSTRGCESRGLVRTDGAGNAERRVRSSSDDSGAIGPAARRAEQRCRGAERPPRHRAQPQCAIAATWRRSASAPGPSPARIALPSGWSVRRTSRRRPPRRRCGHQATRSRGGRSYPPVAELRCSSGAAKPSHSMTARLTDSRASTRRRASRGRSAHAPLVVRDCSACGSFARDECLHG